MKNEQLLQKAANTIRILSADAIEKAKSGHPGMSMGCADYAMMVFFKYMRHNPHNPKWLGRDRFVLSAGHGSMLLYSLLHLFNYGVSMDDLKSFRQWGSLTPGHPEFNHTPGVDITTGPLGSGISSAVGMAIAAKHFDAVTKLDQSGIPSNRIFVICGDGCMMEGATYEAASLAGHLKLDNMVVFYDKNNVTIEGGINMAFTEDVAKRFEAAQWRVIHIDNANDLKQCDEGLARAMTSDGRPTLIIGRTEIGFGAPTKQGKSSSHGEPLGADELAGAKKNLGMPAESFVVEDDVRTLFNSRVDELIEEAAAWDAKFESFLAANPEQAKLIDQMLNRQLPENLKEEFAKVIDVSKPQATRASGGAVLQKAAELFPSIIGGAADLAPSTKSEIKKSSYFSAEDRCGRNIHFGVREMAMGMAGNGMALYGTALPFTSTFFVFSDYMKPALRLAAIQQLHEIYIFTHDSFYVGEDGPTHEPIEQISMLRTIPGLTVIRPADANETAQAYAAALKINGPVALLLTRQNVAPITPELVANINVERGAYVLQDQENFEAILIATGSEVDLALKTAEIFKQYQIPVRVVSMPSQELFLQQDLEYQKTVLPDQVLRVSIEAGSTYGWHRFVGSEGLAIGLDHFGASAPANILAEKFGFTPEGIIQQIQAHFIPAEPHSCSGSCGSCTGCH